MKWFNEENRVTVLAGLVTAVILMTICTNMAVDKLQQQNERTGTTGMTSTQSSDYKELAPESDWYYEDEEYMNELDSLVSTLSVSQALLEKVYPERYNYVASVLWDSRFSADKQSKVLLSDGAYRDYCDYFFLSLSNQSKLDYAAAKAGYYQELDDLSEITLESTLEEMAEEEDGYERFILKERWGLLPTIEYRRVFRNKWGRDTLLYILSQPNNRKTTVILDMYTNGTVHSYMHIRD